VIVSASDVTVALLQIWRCSSAALVTAIRIRTEIYLVLQNAVELGPSCVPASEWKHSEELFIPGKFGAPITQFDKAGRATWSKLMFIVTILILFSSGRYSQVQSIWDQAHRKVVQEARITGNKLICPKRETTK
jgi:hypothetical protein